MSVVFAIPVAVDDIDRAGQTFRLWRRQGYQTAALIDGDEAPGNCDAVIRRPYEGWAWAVNRLCTTLQEFEWIVTGGADVLPDPTRTADGIEAECYDHFGGTYGVMQPVGDPYGALGNLSACVSPWLGKQWRERHPLHEGYWHFWADTELAAVAGSRGRLWWNHEITQRHDHWARKRRERPRHLDRAVERHAADKALFELRKSAGFP
jgi:hypothetical protein